uniref:Reverse transcriptase/retrotransposon-derived protein RNase H-like domain-containing protein n=1 Tax=Crocodylus porosus TaxID=8502 RepID=A0A7M4F985_CROPO
MSHPGLFPVPPLDPWILRYASIVKPLQNLTLVNTPEPLPWTSEIEATFASIKQAVLQAPALGLPDYSKPFILFCHEKDGFALAVLTQTHGNKHCPIAYYSSALDPVAAGFPPCLRAVAAATVTVEVSSTLLTRNLMMMLHTGMLWQILLPKLWLFPLLRLRLCFCLFQLTSLH